MGKDIGLEIPSERLEAFCRLWDIAEISLFGSVLREDFGPDSDVDVLVTFLSETERGLFDLVRMQNELKEIFGRDVDIVTRKAIESSRNHIRRKSILDSARLIYAKG